MKKLILLLFIGFSPLAFAQYTSIPDPVFEQKLIDLGIDTDATLNGQVLNSDILDVHSLNLNGGVQVIQDLTGIEGFVHLDTLICNNHEIDQIDFSANTQLKFLDLYHAGLQSLDVSALTQLEYLNCSNELASDYVSETFNYITNLDLSQNVQLKELYANANGLTNISWPVSANLEHIQIMESSLTDIDLCSLPGLQRLEMPYNSGLTTVDLSCNPALVYVDLNKCGLSGIDLSQNQALETLILGHTDVTYWSYSINEEVGGENVLPDLDISALTNLKYLQARRIGLTQLDVSNNPNLEVLAVSKNPLYNIDVSANANLRALNVKDCYLTSLDVSQNPELRVLTTGKPDIFPDNTYNFTNLIPHVDLSNNPNLESFSAYDTGLLQVDVSTNPLLEYIDISNNPLTTFSIADNPEVMSLHCKNTSLHSLDIQNAHNDLLNYFYATGNPDLYCIQVDDVTYAENVLNWEKDPQAVYSIDCSMGISENQAMDIQIYPVPADDQLYIEGQIADIQSVSIYDVAGKRVCFQPVFNTPYVSLQNLSQGVYFIEFYSSDDTGKIRKKFVKN